MDDGASQAVNNSNRKSWQGRSFEPHPILRNSHLMTIIPGFLPRKNLANFKKSGTPRLFRVNNDAEVLGYCHFQKDSDKPTLIVLHGLEGSSESSHVLGIGYKAFQEGFSVVRLNMRNCGGTMQYSTTLYNAGMWHDLRAVMKSLHKEDRIENFALAGYSLGGNLILNACARHDASLKFNIKGACAVSPAIDLANAVRAIERPENRIYQDWFLRTLKRKIVEKSKQHPDIYDPSALKDVLTIRQFDDVFTAPHGGYGNADRYYREASSYAYLKHIKIPTLIISAEDDPLVPIDCFSEVQNLSPFIELLITKFGGHGGFLQSQAETDSSFDHFWAENRVVAFLREVSID